MGQIIDEGKFNENTYLIDGMLFRLPGTIAIYVIENGGECMMFDTSEPLSARKIVKKLKEYDLFPIQKLFLTHSHWDHVQGWERMKKLNGDFEILASENAIKHLKDPELARLALQEDYMENMRKGFFNTALKSFKNLESLNKTINS